ncbi:hypothetical protein, partial [uncultured Acetobacterium sp.]|uniref:hypothetical protein n=1 Tax=uncultured Acetobacterium sp. TaxID=217139 RepID=UPI0025F8B072
FGSLMDIDKLTLPITRIPALIRFGSLMDIDKLTREQGFFDLGESFGSLMDITGYYETSGSTKKMSLIWKTIPWIINNLMVILCYGCKLALYWQWIL